MDYKILLELIGRFKQVKAGDLVLYDKLYFEGKDNNRYQTISMAYGSTTRYSFCFDNNMARFTPKTVSFTLSMEEKVKQSPGKFEYSAILYAIK